MTNVVDLISEERVKRLATPSNYRLGREIVDDNGVDFTERGSDRLAAVVGGGQRRGVELRSTAEGLAWKCACTSRPDLFCKHLVAAALAAG